MRKLLPFALLMGIATSVSPAISQEAPNIASGRKLANAWCSECHVVAAGQPKAGNDAIPTFGAIANTPGTTEMALKAYLATPHPIMPNVVATRQQIDDIVAYILSLRTR
jgi:cytochrome c